MSKEIFLREIKSKNEVNYEEFLQENIENKQLNFEEFKNKTDINDLSRKIDKNILSMNIITEGLCFKKNVKQEIDNTIQTEIKQKSYIKKRAMEPLKKKTEKAAVNYIIKYRRQIKENVNFINFLYSCLCERADQI